MRESNARHARIRLIGWMTGTGLLTIGLAIMITPLPLGIVVAAAGLTILLSISARLRAIVRARRRRHGWLDRSMRAAGRVTPGRFGRILSTVGAGPRGADGTDIVAAR